jgi:hypothetical protein
LLCGDRRGGDGQSGDGDSVFNHGEILDPARLLGGGERLWSAIGARHESYHVPPLLPQPFNRYRSDYEQRESSERTAANTWFECYLPVFVVKTIALSALAVCS